MNLQKTISLQLTADVKYDLFIHPSIPSSIHTKQGTTGKPRYMSTIGKREFWRNNEFGDRSMSGFLSVTCQHSKIRMRYW